jgi:small subunit ribosomal protein S1
MDFGAFIELAPGEDALLHSTDIIWDSFPSFSSKLENNQHVDVVVLEIDDAAGNVLVGLKQLVFSLWETAQSRFPVGAKASVKVLAVTSDSALVELEPGVQGVITRKELSWDGQANPTDLLAVCDQVEALVCGFDNYNLRFSLSRRLLLPDPWESEKELYSVGSIISGKVINLVDFGAFIRLPSGKHGLIHINDMS